MSFFSPRSPSLAMFSVVVLLAVAGCSEDDPVRVQDDPDLGPDNPDELVSQFRRAYEDLDLANYLALLDPSFLMLLSPETTLEFPTLGPDLDLAEEERIHQRIFARRSVLDPNGDLVPGVVAISFRVFQAEAVWAPTQDEVNFPDTVWAPFRVSILFDRGQQFSTMKVEGSVNIHARAHEATVGGTKKTYYLLAGLADLTYLGKGTETSAWGSVKALFR